MSSKLSYFSVLGLDEGARPDEIEERYRNLAEYFSSSEFPDPLQEWAWRHAALLDEAYAILLDPEQSEEAGPVAPAHLADNPEFEGNRPNRGRVSRGRVRSPGRQIGGGNGLQGRRGVLYAIGVAALIVGGYFIGTSLQGDSDPAPPVRQSQAQDAIVPLDPARVAQLTKQLQANPNDTAALWELGEAYFEAAQWQNSIDTLTKLQALEPNNIPIRTDIGTANFNLGRSADAKAIWQAALQIAPNDVQLHYNMGFFYANVEPKDIAAARQEWQKVLSLAPESSLAKTVRAQLDTLK